MKKWLKFKYHIDNLLSKYCALFEFLNIEVKMSQKKINYDVVISGGGIAGVSCAYNCAKLKLKTLLVEKESYLGGDITGSLVIPVMKCDTENINQDFYKKLVLEAKKFGAQIEYGDKNSGWFNPILLKSVLEKILTDAGADLLFESEISKAETSGNHINEVEILSNTLSLPIVSKYYVDATGNAAFSKLLNCELWSDETQKQPSSLRFIVSGVNLEELKKFLDEIDNDKNVTTTYRIDTKIHLSTAYTWDNSKKWALEPYFKKAIADGVLKPNDEAYFQIFTVANMTESVAFNCPRLQDYSNNDPFEYSKAIIEARCAIIRLHDFVKKYIKGFENSYISNIAAKVGKRETNRVKCLYDYSVDDIISEKKFENPALKSNYPIDIHSNKKDCSVLYKVCSYELPVESLKSKNYSNLYVAGKIAGSDFKAQGALRVQSSCMSMGEAVAKDIKKNIN